MSPRDRIIEGVRKLLEKQYLESVGEREKDEFTGLSESEKRAAVKAFLEKRTARLRTAQWVRVLEHIL
jgi:hypothetical protein